MRLLFKSNNPTDKRKGKRMTADECVPEKRSSKRRWRSGIHLGPRVGDGEVKRYSVCVDGANFWDIIYTQSRSQGQKLVFSLRLSAVWKRRYLSDKTSRSASLLCMNLLLGVSGSCQHTWNHYTKTHDCRFNALYDHNYRILGTPKHILQNFACISSFIKGLDMTTKRATQHQAQ